MTLFLLVWGGLVSAHGDRSAILDNWPIALAMLFGSYVAGSTPLGGGVVAFPILVLGFDMQPSVGRDFSFAIQAIGMTSASLWILAARRPVASGLLKGALLGATLATPLACRYLAPAVSPFGAKLTFSVLVGAYGLVQLKHGRRLASTTKGIDEPRSGRVTLGFALGAIGAALSTVSGSGADVVLYVALMLFLGSEVRRALFTSVVIMAWTSVVGILTLLAMGEVQPGVRDAWLAASPVVVFGAPLGALAASYMPRNLTLNIVSTLCLGQVVWMCLHEGLGLQSQLGVWLAVVGGFALLQWTIGRAAQRTASHKPLERRK